MLQPGCKTCKTSWNLISSLHALFLSCSLSLSLLCMQLHFFPYYFTKHLFLLLSCQSALWAASFICKSTNICFIGRMSTKPCSHTFIFITAILSWGCRCRERKKKVLYLSLTKRVKLYWIVTQSRTGEFNSFSYDHM